VSPLWLVTFTPTFPKPASIAYSSRVLAQTLQHGCAIEKRQYRVHRRGLGRT